MKKTISMLLALLFLTSVLTGCENTSTDAPSVEPSQNSSEGAARVESPAADFEYEEGEDYVAITNYIGNDTDVVIPEMIAGKEVKGIYSFPSATVVSVDIPDTVISIRAKAFERCSALTKVVLPKNLTKIDEYTFNECSSLAEIVLPESLTTIGEYAFYMCTSLKHIRIPKSVTEWDLAFSDSGLETVELAEGLESIGAAALAATNLREVVLPSSMKTIGDAAFYKCEKLTSVTLNEGLVSLSWVNTFALTGLTEIVIPSTVTDVTEADFEGCDSLQKMKFEGNAPSDFAFTPLALADENGDPLLDEDGNEIYDDIQGSYTVYYHEGAQGFTSPEWNGYTTEIW